MKNALYTLIGAAFLVLPNFALAYSPLLNNASLSPSGVLTWTWTHSVAGGFGGASLGCDRTGGTLPDNAAQFAGQSYPSFTVGDTATLDISTTSGTYDNLVNNCGTNNPVLIRVDYNGNNGPEGSSTANFDSPNAEGFFGVILNTSGQPPVQTGVPTSSTKTSIQITNPTQGTSTPSTTFDIDATYTIGTDLSTFSIDGSLPTQIGINFTLLNVETNQQINLGTDYSISQGVGTYSYATTTTQAQSDYTLVATLVGDYGFTPPPAGCTPFPPFTTCTGSGNISTLATALPAPTFSVDNGLFPILGFQVGSTTSRSGLATTTCSITAIGGCFQNALAFLFFPSPDILNQFANLWSLIENKPPFGYVSQTITSLRTLNASSTPAFSFGDIPLVDTIFTPFRTGLAALLWVGFFIAWYRGRLRHLDI